MHITYTRMKRNNNENGKVRTTTRKEKATLITCKNRLFMLLIYCTAIKISYIIVIIRRPSWKKAEASYFAL